MCSKALDQHDLSGYREAHSCDDKNELYLNSMFIYGHVLMCNVIWFLNTAVPNALHTAIYSLYLLMMRD